ncbi:MAG TPA: UDP-glucose 4-epimerase GalE [Cyclobacteriaceae bacterium]|jgi:UDP-glucose 4-epimerase
MSKIIVTGGLGYIGSHTAVDLLNDGFDVVIVDDLSNSQRDILRRIETITGKNPEFLELDVSVRDNVMSMLRRHSDAEAIIHFAASKAVGESVAKPLLYYRNNLNSMIFLLEGMLETGIANIVFSSSCTVYGQPDKLPVTESTPFRPAESPYGNTKQICEEILRDVCAVNKNIQSIALRYFNPVGAHDSCLIGELPRGVPNNLVPYITQTAAGILPELRIFGNDYDTPDGTPVRDYIHVVDLAIAHRMALRRLMERQQKSNYEYFNLGTGNGHTVLEVVKAFENAAGVQLRYRIVARRPGDVEKIWADTSLANRELGWKAERSLHDMMQSAWNWQLHLRDHPDLLEF